MATQYTQNFTLTNIFNNKKLEGKIPLINYHEKELENGKISKRTNAKTINKLVFDIAKTTAKPYYKPISVTIKANLIEIGGKLVGEQNSVVDAIFNALLSQRDVMTYTVNNADLIRSALKEAEKNKRKFGIDTRLHLRVQSMTEIEGMSKKQIMALMNNIMENIFYGDNFPETQKKYNLKDLQISSKYNYEQRKQMWKNRIGE